MATVSISGLMLTIILLFVFRKPVKTLTEQTNRQLPKTIAAAAEAAANSAMDAAFRHRLELNEQLQEEFGVTLNDINDYYEALASGKTKKRSNP